MMAPASLYVSRSNDASDMLGMARAARMPMIMTTTISSMSEKPAHGAARGARTPADMETTNRAG